jgi:nucleoid-associated protein YgaU
MRKDVRLGLAVGVVLVAVIVVYLIVASGPKDNKPATIAGGGPARVDRGPSDAVPTPPDATPNDAISNRTIDVAGPATAPSERPVAGGAREGDAGSPANWGDLLLHGRDVATNVTRTPGESIARADVPRANVTADSPRAAEAVDSGPGVPIFDTPPVTRTPEFTRTPDPAPATRPSGKRSYTVRDGDSFYSIARAQYGNGAYAAQIQAANPNVHPQKLRANMTLVLPEIAETPASIPGGGVSAGPATRPIDATREYRVQNGDSLYAICVRLYGRGDKAGKLYELNKSLIGPDSSKLKIGMVLQLAEPPTRH